MKGILVFCGLLLSQACMAQTPENEDAMDASDIPWKHDFFALASFSVRNQHYNTYPSALFFQFKSATPNFLIQQSMPMKDLSNLLEFSIAGDLHFRNRIYVGGSLEFGGSPHIDLNRFSVAVGYGFSLKREDHLFFRPSVSLSDNYLGYRLGTNYSDPSNTGILVNGHNIGSSIMSITYVSDNLSMLPALDLIYRFNMFSVIAGIGYNVPFHAREFIRFQTEKYKFYRSGCNSDNYIYDSNGHALHDQIIVNGMYWQVKVGIAFRFGS